MQPVIPTNTARAPPAIGANLTFTSAALAQTGNMRALDGVENTGADYALLRSSFAPNRTGPRVVAQDGDVFEYSMTGRNGSNITVITNQARDGNRLVLSDLHIDGAGAGTSSVRELRQFARDLGKQQGVDQVVIKGGTRTTGANPGHTPRDIIIRVNE
ncbi:hypothetical protein ACVDG9_07370 [Roseibium sp. RP-7]